MIRIEVDPKALVGLREELQRVPAAVVQKAAERVRRMATAPTPIQTGRFR